MHLAIGVAGNVVFFVGSVLFIWSWSEQIAVCLFIVGSFGMMLGAIGQAFYIHERHRLNGTPGERPAGVSARN
ncbi:YrhK family protein [Amycolatopsis thermophila]|uniref:YrhK domain-containing protein n=1 Tax=Amycolatopsis thermophila TaxID=206084 RepID=A0ABU0F2R0_9PSEU|nr:YrhK family protein [Amycolatopsis thermophila]MDQ0381456.1 hypothetical protein [Amycolatopsis thermophila]